MGKKHKKPKKGSKPNENGTNPESDSNKPRDRSRSPLLHETSSDSDSDTEMEHESSKSNAQDGEWQKVGECTKRKRPINQTDDDEDDDDNGHDNENSKSEGGDNHAGSKQPSLLLYIASEQINFSHLDTRKLNEILDKYIEGYPKSIEFTRNGKLKVVCADTSQYNLIRKLKVMDGYTVNIELPVQKPQLNYCLINGVSLDYTVEDIKSELNITPNAVYRTKRAGEYSTTIKLGYASSCPQNVRLGYITYTTRLCTDRPVRCFKCQRFGHVMRTCESKDKCPRCSGEHSFDKCPSKDNRSKALCANCGGAHSAAYAGCPSYREATKINQIKLKNNVSYAQALKQFKKGHPKAMPTPPPAPVHLPPQASPVVDSSQVREEQQQDTTSSTNQPQGDENRTGLSTLQRLQTQKLFHSKCYPLIESLVTEDQQILSTAITILHLVLNHKISMKEVIKNIQVPLVDVFGTVANQWSNKLLHMTCELEKSFIKYHKSSTDQTKDT